ncbi:hypothetical protein V6U90_07975 [Micromonospora sp. CPCC 206060]|uniref:hypothetical protein n=1 Tax=Micromonospora sp. CPCC 206060 TaxID=3122406 RepID=UPI002FEEC574
MSIIPAILATREQAFALVMAGIMSSLPIPTDIRIGHDHTLVLHLGNDFPGGVWAWTRYLSLPDPAAGGKPILGADRWFDSFGAEVSRASQHQALPGWSVRVVTYITVNAPAEQVTR